jgi:type I restriction enzyme, S subunit
MGKLIFDYVPLTFISDKGEIKKQIRNTLILIHLFEKYNNPVRLEKLIEGTQYGYNASALQSGNNKFLRISDIHESKVNWETVPYCNCDDEETYVLKNDDILIARTGGTTGKSFKINNPPKDSIYAGYLIRIRAKATVNPDYLYLFLHSFAYWSQIVNLNERNFRPKANAENLKSLILPECPKAVQDEAVLISQGQKIIGYEGLYAEIETALSEYDKAQKVQDLLSDQLIQLENLNQAILQEAVQGKLVKQNPKDEPASELLKRIKAEKAKSGKKEKQLPPIKPAEIPFKIPESWVWCRLGEICEIKGGKRVANGYQLLKTPTPHIYIRVTDMKNGTISTADVHYIDEIMFQQIKQYTISKNDIYMTIVGATIGKCGLVPEKFHNMNLTENAAKISPIFVDKDFLYQCFDSPFCQSQFIDKTKQVAVQKMALNRFSSSIIPLPPLSEQKRIVAEIEKQLAKTKQLKEHIIANQHATEQLLKALLHGAFQPQLAVEVEVNEEV